MIAGKSCWTLDVGSKLEFTFLIFKNTNKKLISVYLHLLQRHKKSYLHIFMWFWWHVFLKKPNWIELNLLYLWSMSRICFVWYYFSICEYAHETGSCWVSGHCVSSAMSAHCQLFKHYWIHCGLARSIWEPDFSCGHTPSSVLYFLTEGNYIEIIFLLEFFKFRNYFQS